MSDLPQRHGMPWKPGWRMAVEFEDGTPRRIVYWEDPSSPYPDEVRPKRIAATPKKVRETRRAT